MSESKYKNAVCKGSYIFGTACGHCERCKEEIEKNGKEWNTMSEENKLQKYGVVSISRGGEVWDEVQKNNSGNYYLVEDVDLVIEKLKGENQKLKAAFEKCKEQRNELKLGTMDILKIVNDNEKLIIFNEIMESWDKELEEIME